MESFFHSLKAELIHGEEFKNEHQLRLALSGYINQFYNRNRLHWALGYLSPVKYERVMARNEACPFYRGKVTLLMSRPCCRYKSTLAQRGA